MKLNIQLFASGTIDGTSTASNATCRVVWTSTPNNAGNYSTITAEAQLYKSGSSSTTGTFKGVININDVEYEISRKFSPYRWGNWETVGTATATVQHNNNGTKDTNISTYFYNTGTSMAGDYSTPYPNYVQLDTIPRGSTFNTSSWNRDTQRQMNSTLSFPATQNVSGVYHKLVAKFMNNGTETTICTRTGVSISGGYISFSFSSGELSTIYNLMPNETTHYIRMYLYTYTNSSYTNQLGDVSILWWTGAIPSSVVPSASFTSYVEGGDVPSAWGVWVKGKSKANLTLTGTGVYSSTISAYSISGDGYTYNTSPVLTNYLSQAGNITFTGVVTDSRGRTGTATTTLSVVDYTNPTISTAQVQRCDVDGNIDNNGEYVYISYGASISSCSGENTPNAVYKVGYRIHNTGDYTYIPLTTNANSYSATGMLYTDGIFAADRGSGTKLQLSTSNTYDIQLFVSDYFTNSTSLQILDTGFDLMNFNPSGKAMAIGKVSEAGANEELFEIGMDTRIIENGITTQFDNSSGYSHYRTNGGNGHWFNTDVKVNGNVYGGEGYYNKPLAYKEDCLAYTYAGTSKNLNDYKTPGVYGLYGCTNQPPSVFTNLGSLVVVKYSVDWIAQFWIEQAATPIIWQRSWYGGNTWSSWQRIVATTKVTLNNEWIMGYKASGDNLSVMIPFNNPNKKAVTVNITSAEIYSGGWQTITYGGVTALETFVKLGFSTSASLTNGNVYLVRISGTISI